MKIINHDLSKCKTKFEEHLVTALLEIQVHSKMMPKSGTQEAIWRTLTRPFDEMEKLGIIDKR